MIATPRYFVLLSALLFGLVGCGDENTSNMLTTPIGSGMPTADASVGTPGTGSPDAGTPGGNTPADGSAVYTLKQGRIADESVITVDGVVTALRLNAEGRYSHLVLQVPSDNGGYRGDENSGLWVYLNNTDMEILRDNPPAVGTWVSVTGQAYNYYDQWQIHEVSRLDELGPGTLPSPIVVDAAAIATGGAQAWLLEGMLVTVQNVTVTQHEPTVGDGDGMDMDGNPVPTNEFVVTGGLRVNDFLYFAGQLPDVGSQFTSITGIVRWGNGNSKLEPRQASDYQ